MGMDTGTGGAITAVAAITTVGTAATTMVGGIITIGGDFNLRPSRKGCLSWRPLFISANRSMSPIVELAAIKKTQSLPAMERRVVLGKITMRTRWSIAIHHENRSEDSLMTEDHFVHFADVHQRMKRDKDKIFVVRIPKNAKPMEVQAFNNLRRLGYRVETR